MIETLVEFFEKRPEIRNKYSFTDTFNDYTREIIETVVPHKDEGTLLKATINEIQRLLPDRISIEDIKEQLMNYPIISTADHHGLLNYNLLYNSNILFSEIMKRRKLKYIVVLATGNIPLNNISHPRGFYFKKEKFNFFKSKGSSVPVFLFKNQLYADRTKGLDSVVFSYNRNSLTVEEKKFLEYLFFECLEIEKAANYYESFSDQITFINYKLWKYYFDKSLRDSVPGLIYLQSNQIIDNILLKEIKKKDSLVSKILLEPDVREVYLRNFNEIPGCWGSESGSHFFWGINEIYRWIRLCFDKESNCLVGDGLRVELERENLIELLKSKKILPTTFLVFLIITFIEGYLAMGGLNQIEYLPKMREAQEKSLKEIGINVLADTIAAPVTHGLICGMYPFDYDSGIDLMWHYNSHNGKFNGNMDGGLTNEKLDSVSDMLFTELIYTGIDKTLKLF